MFTALQLMRKPALRAAYSSLTAAEADFRKNNPYLGKIADTIAGYRRMIKESHFDEKVGITYLSLIKQAKTLAVFKDHQEETFFNNWVIDIEDNKPSSRLTP